MQKSKPTRGFYSVRVRLAGTVLLAIVPALLVLYYTRLGWTGIGVAVLCLIAGSWYAGGHFVLRHVHRLVAAARRLGEGDLASRTGMENEPGEFGVLARTFDAMATSLQQRIKEHEDAEQRFLNRALQQTAVSALGQFALTTADFPSLCNHAVMLISQTLEVEFCRILELQPDRKSLLLRAGVGWKKGLVGSATVPADPTSQAGFTLGSGEPTVIKDLRSETRFQSEPLLVEHSIISGVSVAVGSGDRIYGVLGVYVSRRRDFTGEDVQFLLAVANALDVAVERQRGEVEREKLAEFARLNPNPVMELAADGTINYFNHAAMKLAGAVGKESPREVLPQQIVKVVTTCLQTGRSEWNLQSQQAGRVLSWSLYPVTGSKVVHCYVTDITDRLSLEAQLRQSQKMESVGQLAAGVAHDFNNMLTVIQGHAGLLIGRGELTQPLRDSVQAIFFAAERAAGLTRQLLTFSRKTVMEPRLLDLRESVSNMSSMLKRLLGETIALDFSRPPDLPLVRGDQGMIEQVIMNLAVNARDAMPTGGKLIISIQPVSIDVSYLQTHADAREGDFVLLRVTDTGTGMSAATMSRIFEPFFTTKEPGKGTGLGLATVYGIIKQHSGWIEVSSDVGKGTSFGIFLPVTTEKPAATKPGESLVAPVRGGNETILLVEDEPSVLTMGKVILQDCGYTVLEAYSGVKAVEVWNKQQGKVDLLLTDVVMPEGVSGVELAQKLMTQRPGLKVVFTSGYNVNHLDTEFIRKGGGVFLQKPYTRSSLARVVRACLDAKLKVEAGAAPVRAS